MSELSANQKAMNYILDIIKDAHFKEGYKLPTEEELSRKLGISRNSVREALKTLQNIGIINSIRGSGYKLEPDLEGSLLKITQTLFDIMPNTYNYKDISDIREVLELKTLLLLQNQKIEPEDIHCLEKYVSNMEHNIDPEENDQKFHMKLAAMSNNSLMHFVSSALLSRVSKNYILIPWNAISEEEKNNLIASHKDIIKWISKNAPDDIIMDNPISTHYKIADSIINKQNKLYDDASLANMTINDLIKLGISIDKINLLFNEAKNNLHNE